MTLYSSASDQHRVFFFNLSVPTFENSLKTEALPVNPCDGLCHHCSLCQLCWAHAALQVSMQHLFHCFFLQAWELLRAPEKIWFEIQQHQDASHKCQQSWREATCGAPATLPCIWAVTWALIFLLLSLTGIWAALLFSTGKHAASAANTVAMQGGKGGKTQWAKPHTRKCGSVYLDFRVERKDVLSSIISAQFV